jgi:hypothetical protein
MINKEIKMLLYEIVEEFKKNKISFVVIGGYALALHGLVRATIDIDIILKINLSNYEKAEASLKKIGLTSRIPVRAEDIVKMRVEYIENRNLLAWSFVDYKNPTRQVDILIKKNIDEVEIETISVGGYKIPVATLKSLIELKEESARPQDLIDIKNIKEYLNAKKKS